MRHGGPVLTASLWDPRRPRLLSDRLEEVVASASLPVSTEAGDAAGCHHLHLWAGDLGLGLPEDPPVAWERLGADLGGLVVAVRPALALVAAEWGAEGLLDPDPELLRPGLACGWVRSDGLDAARTERFARLAGRGTVRPYAGGLAWAAEGTVSLDGLTAGPPSEVVEQVFRAWTGESPTDSAGSTRLVLGVPEGVGEDEVAAALPAGYEVLGVAGAVAVTRPPVWAVSPAADLVEAGALLDAGWGLVEAVEHGSRGPVAFWVPASRPGLLDQLGDLLPGAGRAPADGGTLLTTRATDAARQAGMMLR